MKSGIYQLRNLANGHRYIGSAGDLARRKSSHFDALRRCIHHSQYLQSAYNKYGGSSFVFETVLVCDPENLLLYEQMCIDGLKPGYNICKIAGNCRGIKRSDEFKKHVSEMLNGHATSEETRKKISEAHTGWMPSVETLKRMSEGQKKRTKGRELSEETKRKISAAHLGMRHSEESRKKIGEMQKGRISSRKGVKLSEEIRRKISAALRGKQLSEEQRQKRIGRKASDETQRKMSVAQKERWQQRKASAR